MAEGFDKKAFEQKQENLLKICLAIGAIGVVSLVCSFLIGGGF